MNQGYFCLLINGGLLQFICFSPIGEIPKKTIGKLWGSRLHFPFYVECRRDPYYFFVNNMHNAIVLNVLPSLPEGVEANDPNDVFLLAMALAGEADYLVTGDRRAGLLQRGSIGRARIVTPAAFCAEAL